MERVKSKAEEIGEEREGEKERGREGESARLCGVEICAAVYTN